MYLRKVIIFVFIVWGLFSVQAFADAMQERRIMISASIFPRLIAVDLNLLEKLDKSGNVRLGVIYHSDIDQAKKIEKLILRKVKRIAGKNIVVDYIKLKEIDQLNNGSYSGLFVAQVMSKPEIRKIIQFSNKQNILNFSPFEGDVERGISASIFVGAKIRPYFNIKSLKKSGVSLKPALLKVSKAYE